MEVIVPKEPTKGQRRCEHGLLRDGKCQGGVRYRFMSDTSAYFTTWNLYLTIIGVFLAVFVYLPANLINGGSYLATKDAWWINYLITPFIIMVCIVSIGVFISSQSIWAYNFQELIEVDDRQMDQTSRQHVSTRPRHGQLTGAAKRSTDRIELGIYLANQQIKRDPAYLRQKATGERQDLLRLMKNEQHQNQKERTVGSKSLSHPDVDAHSIAVEIPYVEYMLKDNFVVHTAPAIVSIVLILMLSVGTFKTAERETVSLVTLVMCLILFGAYLAVPVEDQKTGELHMGWDKVAHVYSNPSGWIFGGQAVFTFAAALIIPFFVIGRGPCAMDNMTGRLSKSDTTRLVDSLVSEAEVTKGLETGLQGGVAAKTSGSSLVGPVLGKSDIFTLRAMP